MHRLVQLQTEYYDNEGYLFNGPGALTEAMQRLCNSSALESHQHPVNKTRDINTSRRRTCSSDVQFVSKKEFHPIGNSFIGFLFKTKSSLSAYDQAVYSIFLDRIQSFSHGVHFYDSFTHNLSVDLTPNSTQMFAYLAAQHCPITLSSAHQFT